MVLFRVLVDLEILSHSVLAFSRAHSHPSSSSVVVGSFCSWCLGSRRFLWNCFWGWAPKDVSSLPLLTAVPILSACSGSPLIRCWLRLWVRAAGDVGSLFAARVGCLPSLRCGVLEDKYLTSWVLRILLLSVFGGSAATLRWCRGCSNLSPSGVWVLLRLSLLGLSLGLFSPRSTVFSYLLQPKLSCCHLCYVFVIPFWWLVFSVCWVLVCAFWCKVRFGCFRVLLLWSFCSVRDSSFGASNC